MQLNEKELLTSANKLQQTRISQKSSESMKFQESLVPQSGLRWSLHFYPSVKILTLKVRLESEELQAVLEKNKNKIPHCTIHSVTKVRKQHITSCD